MPFPLRIAVRGATLSAAERFDLEASATGLEEFFPRIVSCDVGVDGPGGHHRMGEFRVRINLAVPTRRIVISRRKSGTFHEALVDAFRAAGRRLEDHARKIRGDVKRHSA